MFARLLQKRAAYARSAFLRKIEMRIGADIVANGPDDKIYAFLGPGRFDEYPFAFVTQADNGGVASALYNVGSQIAKSPDADKYRALAWANISEYYEVNEETGEVAKADDIECATTIAIILLDEPIECAYMEFPYSDDSTIFAISMALATRETIPLKEFDKLLKSLVSGFRSSQYQRRNNHEKH